MEGAKHRLVRSEGMKDPPPGRASLSKAVPRLGGSRHATRRKLTRIRALGGSRHAPSLARNRQQLDRGRRAPGKGVTQWRFR
jgi:hypothetical protein